MKTFYFFCLLALSLHTSAQAVLADPAVGAMNITDNTTNVDRSTTIAGTPVKLTLPIINGSPFNAIPTGSTQIVIGLGGKLALSPSFNMATARLSNYFTFTYNTAASQPRIIGTQIAPIPSDFNDTTSFQVVGTSSGSSTASVNFQLVGNVDDENPNNNFSSVQYKVLITLPVTMSRFDVAKTGCNINVAFTSDEEKNVSGYVVEASKDGSTFSTLGEIAAVNAGHYAKSFPITEGIKAANLFVRVKTVDKDGQFVYSAIKKVSGECDSQKGFVLGLYPNPVTAASELTVTSKEGFFEGRFNVSVIDVNGRIVQLKQLQLSNTSSFHVNVGNIPSGHYLIKVTNASETLSSVLHFNKN